VEITFLGANCLRITGRDIAILTDPYKGMPEVKQKNEATLLSQVFAVPTSPNAGMVIDSPGEYEISGTTITGVPARLHIDESGYRGTMYSVAVDDVRVGVLGNIVPELTDSQVEALGPIDVLAIPVGGHGLTLDATAAAKIISQLEPKYVIPTHYDDGKTKYEMPQDKLEVFLKEIGSAPEPIAKLKIAAKDLPLETTVVVLERSGG
jgi:L-ascorbate metabolism protein UlaG (beta-lactamase superfamily)